MGAVLSVFRDFYTGSLRTSGAGTLDRSEFCAVMLAREILSFMKRRVPANSSALS